MLAAISEVVLPLVFAVMIGATAYPLARRLHRRMSPALSALVVVRGMGVVVAAVAVVGGIVGLVLAVPVTVVPIELFRRLRAAGTLSTVRARAAVVAAETVRGPH